MELWPNMVDFLDSKILSEAAKNSFKANSFKKVEHIGFPTSKQEEWRFISLKGLTKSNFKLNEAKVDESSALTHFGFSEGIRLVFVDGFFKASMSNLEAVKGLSIEEIETPSMDSNAFEDDYFTALNESFFTTSWKIRLEADRLLQKPVLLYHLQSGEASTYSAPRVLIEVGSGSIMTVVEHFTSINSDTSYFANPFTSVHVDNNAKVIHYRVQRESLKAYHTARVQANVEANANYSSYSFNFGALLSRTDLRAMQMGLESHITIDGLVMIKGNQVSDTHTVMDHRFAHGTSHQLHKVLADEKSHSVFNGKIFVRQDAQKIDSFQENRNILLSESAKVNTKPQLEIFADDVRCSHGATIGQMDDEELFYLKSRGLTESQAKLLITRGFALEVIEEIEIPELVELLSKDVEAYVV